MSDLARGTGEFSQQGMTIRGSLTMEQLQGVFQMLTTSRSEGTLRIGFQGREKRIYIHPDGISLLSTGKKLPRIGDLLVSMGKLQRKQLSAALSMQRGGTKKIGDLLKEQGLITEEDISNAVQMQIEEEINEIFCWESAAFEFREGPPEEDFFNSDSPLTSLSFPAGPLLQRAMDRMSEWEEISKNFSHFHEVLLFDGDPEKSGALDFIPMEVLELLDGTNSVEDLLTATCQPRFETSRSLVKLLDSGMVRRVLSPELCAKAEEAQKSDLVAKEIKLLVLAHHSEPADRLIHERLSSAYLRIGNNKEAARFEFLIASNEEQVGNLRGAAEMREQALSHDPTNLEAREKLLQYYHDAKKPEKQLQHGKLLAQSLIDRKQNRDALAILKILSQTHPDQADVHGLAVNANLALKDEKAALEQYTAMAACLRKQGETSRLIDTLKKMVQMDRARKALGKELKQLLKEQLMSDAGYRRKRRMVQGGVGIVLAVVTLAGGYEFMARRALDQANLLLAEGNLQGAQAAYTELIEGYGFSLVRQRAATQLETTNAKLARIQRQRQKNQQKKRKAAKKKIETAFKAAEALLADGNYDEARKQFDALAALHKARADLLARASQGLADIKTARNRSWSERLAMATLVDFPTNLEALDRLLTRSPPEPWRAKIKQAHVEAIQTQDKALTTAFSAQLSKHRQTRKQGKLPAARMGISRLLESIDNWLDKLEALSAPAKMAAQHTAVRTQARSDLDTLNALAEKARMLRAQADKLFRRAQKNAAQADALYAQAYGLYKQLVSDKTLNTWPSAERVRLPVMLTSVPRGAQLLFAGQPAGVTPMLILIANDDQIDVRASLRGYLPQTYRLNSKSGARVMFSMRRTHQWKAPVGGLIEGTPALSGNRLVFGARDGSVYALRADSGKQLWRQRLDALEDVSLTPQILDDKLYVWTVLGSLYCLGLSDGRILWRKRKLEAGSELMRAPLIAAGKVISIGRKVRAFDPTSGQLLWTFEPQDAPVTGIRLIGQRLIFGDQKARLLALTLDGKLVGRTQLETKKIHGELTAQGAQLYVPCSSGLIGLDARTLAPLFRVPLQAKLAGQLVLIGADLMAVTERAELLVFAPRSGQLRRRLRLLNTRQPLFGSTPVFDTAGRCYLSGLDNSLYCFDIQAGTMLWRFSTRGQLLGAPLLTPKYLYVGSHDNTMYALSR